MTRLMRCGRRVRPPGDAAEPADGIGGGVKVHRLPPAVIEARAPVLGRLAATALGSPAWEAAVHTAVIRWAARCPGVRLAVATAGQALAGFALSFPRPPARLLDAWPPAMVEPFGLFDGRPGVIPAGARHLAEICIAARWQRQGLGGRLLDVACPGGGPVVAGTAADSPARGFYRARGFREAGGYRMIDGRQWAVEVRDGQAG